MAARAKAEGESSRLGLRDVLFLVSDEKHENHSHFLRSVELVPSAHLRNLYERYHKQVMSGCGRNNCENRFCASSGEEQCSLSVDEAAARALVLMNAKAPLCYLTPDEVTIRKITGFLT